MKNNLIDKGLIEAGKITTQKGMIKALQLTRKGIEHLNETGYDAKFTNESIEHRYWKNKIAEYYAKLGYKVKIEEPVNGNADIIIEKQN